MQGTHSMPNKWLMIFDSKQKHLEKEGKNHTAKKLKQIQRGNETRLFPPFNEK